MTRKYDNEKMEAQYVISRGLLPFKIVTSVPVLLAKSLRNFFRDRNINNVGTSIDPDNDGLWLHRKYD